MVEALNFPHMGEHYHGWLSDRSDVACVSTIARKVVASACRHSRKRIGILTTHTRPLGGPAPAANVSTINVFATVGAPPAMPVGGKARHSPAWRPSARMLARS